MYIINVDDKDKEGLRKIGKKIMNNVKQNLKPIALDLDYQEYMLLYTMIRNLTQGTSTK